MNTCLKRKGSNFEHFQYVWQDAHTLSGIAPILGVMPTTACRRFTDIPLCLHKRVEVGKMTTFLPYHDIKMFPRYVSND